MIKIGTNFYLRNNEGELTHIAKTSSGWKPLFQAHKLFSSIKHLRWYWDNTNEEIVDEYGNEYKWKEFTDRVINFADDVNFQTHIGLHERYFSDEGGYEWTYDDFR